jgi:hypothetical protein
MILRLCSLLTIISMMHHLNLSYAQEETSSFKLPSQDPQELLYNKIFPQHIKLCFSTHGQEIDSKSGKKAKFIKGTHSFLYLKGVCQDPDASVPQLKKCAEGNWENPNFGVGIGVIEGLKNVKFTIIPELDVLLYGYINPGETLTKERYSEMAETLVNEGLYRGVQWHKSALPVHRKTKKVMSSEDRDTHVIMAKKARGSDWAIALGRTVYCTNIPVTDEQMDKVITYLNRVNKIYSGESDKIDPELVLHKNENPRKSFNFDYIKNSCAHLAANALYELDLLKAFPVNQSLIKALLRVPVPSAMVADVFEFSHSTPLTFEHFLAHKIKMKKISDARGKILEAAYPKIPGVILKHYGIYDQNDLFDPSEDRHLMSTIFYPQRSHRLKTEVFSFKTHNYYRELIKQKSHIDLEVHLRELETSLQVTLIDLIKHEHDLYHKKSIQKLFNQWKTQEKKPSLSLEQLFQEYVALIQEKLNTTRRALDKVKEKVKEK